MSALTVSQMKAVCDLVDELDEVGGVSTERLLAMAAERARHIFGFAIDESEVVTALAWRDQRRLGSK